MDDETPETRRTNLDLVGEVIDMGYLISPTASGYRVTFQGVSIHAGIDEIPTSIAALNLLIAHLSQGADA